VPVGCCGKRAWLFVRGITGRDEQDAIQVQELSGRSGDREVAPVNRIKTAPQESQAHIERAPNKRLMV